MAIRYVSLPLSNPQDLTAPKMYYLIEKSVGNIDRMSLIRDMVRNTSLTQMEAATGIDYLFSAIPRFLEWGFTVQLGDLGYFRVSISSDGSDTADEATPDKIRRKRLNFIPGSNMRQIINGFAVEKFPT